MRPHTPRTHPARRAGVLLGASAILAAVAAVAVLSAGEGEPAVTLDSVAGPVTTDGMALAVLANDGAPDPALGLPAPTTTAVDLAGTPHRLGGAGQAQVLVFLAHWCPACDQELPTLRRLLDAGAVPAGVDLTLVTTGYDPTRPNWPPPVWLREAGLGTVRTVRDDTAGTLMRTYGLSAYPAWLALDRDGTVRARRYGLLTDADIRTLLETVTP